MSMTLLGRETGTGLDYRGFQRRVAVADWGSRVHYIHLRHGERLPMVPPDQVPRFQVRQHCEESIRKRLPYLTLRYIANGLRKVDQELGKLRIAHRAPPLGAGRN